MGPKTDMSKGWRSERWRAQSWLEQPNRADDSARGAHWNNRNERTATSAELGGATETHHGRGVRRWREHGQMTKARRNLGGGVCGAGRTTEAHAELAGTTEHDGRRHARSWAEPWRRTTDVELGAGGNMGGRRRHGEA